MGQNNLNPLPVEFPNRGELLRTGVESFLHNLEQLFHVGLCYVAARRFWLDLVGQRARFFLVGHRRREAKRRRKQHERRCDAKPKDTAARERTGLIRLVGTSVVIRRRQKVPSCGFPPTSIDTVSD